jgi:RES domain-containing protein
MVYLAGSLALAVLEVLVHLNSREELDQYVAFPIQIDAKHLLTLDTAELPSDWRAAEPPAGMWALGDLWAAERTSLGLCVPSAVLSQEKNYLINPRHPAVESLDVGEGTKVETDPRLLET